ncbi:MHS family MFS transporter [Brachybacterium huguangmaarense]|uniref:MHS family MFS transporter n=1 Tax=Brachybacterium huguangmaarense TaxID=1652028 RepID=A0ABY6G0W4_9MICO|nr:MFS transporter [Brachybacterium huguangmaarense]UYG16840.1 MHS family MFS transporter [Brachybacterium huguangmaarense]
MTSLPDTSPLTQGGAPAGAPANTRGRVIVASMIGTTIEFFDFYAYATAASLVFPALFFPTATPANQLLSSFAVFGVAFVARPIGSILFGHFGDRIGRKRTLVASLLVMGVATFIIGLLPTASVPGFAFLAPALLVLLRFCQGVGLGGEWSGAALLATENAPAGKRALYGTFPQLGAPIGFILSNILFVVMSLVLSDAQFTSWGWRVPFLLSAILVVVGLWVRLKLMETPAFQRVIDEQRVAAVPLARVFRTSWRPLILATVAMIATYVLFYMMTAFLMVFGTTASSVEAARAAAESAGKAFDPSTFAPGLGYARPEFLTMLIIGVVFFGVFTLVSGPLADRAGRRPYLIVVTAGIGVYALLIEPLIHLGTPGVMAVLIVGFTLMGLTFGPMAAYLPEMFPADVRYTGSAISYNMASVIGAGPAPITLVALWQALDGSLWLVGVYLLVAALLTLGAVVIGRETRDVDYLA